MARFQRNTGPEEPLISIIEYHLQEVGNVRAKICTKTALLSAALGACALLTIVQSTGCWRQFPSSSAQPMYQFSSSLQTPIGASYPGTRELMNAPSNDPALDNDRNGVDLRP
jgi:hypothetical protein